MSSLIAVDPGREKCGLLIADLDSGLVLDGRVVLKDNVLDLILQWKHDFPVQGIILGNSIKLLTKY